MSQAEKHSSISHMKNFSKQTAGYKYGIRGSAGTSRALAVLRLLSVPVFLATAIASFKTANSLLKIWTLCWITCSCSLSEGET